MGNGRLSSVEVALVVLAVPGRIRVDAVAQSRPQLVRAVARCVEVDGERPVLRVDEVVRAGRADLAHLGPAHRRGEGDRLGAAVDPQDGAGRLREQGAAEGRQRRGQQVLGLLVVERRRLRPTQPEARAGRPANRLGGARDDLERCGIALAARLAPGDETVLLEQHGARPRILAQELGNALRHGEAGALVVEPDGLGAERLVGEPPPVRGGGQGDDRVRVRVVDVRGADERVEERLDGRPRLRGHEGAAEEVVDHLRVLHLLALDQRQDLVEPERGEAFGRDRREVGAGALDPEDARLASEVVTRDPFRRRVSAALVGERSIGPEQVRAIDEACERVEPGRGGGVPEIDRGLDAMQGAGRLLHACTSSRSDSPLTVVEALARLGPFRRACGLVLGGHERVAYQLAPLLERGELAEPHGLHDEVADCGRLDGAGEDGQPGGACGPPAEELVLRAAADDVHLGGGRAGRVLQQANRLRVPEGQALQDAAGDGPGLDRLSLSGAGAELADPLRHVPRGREAAVVRVDERAQGRGLGRERDELVEPVVAAFLRPGPAALVQEPEAGDVAEQAGRPGDATFVGQVRGEGPVVDQRRVELQADERPRAGADVGGARLPEGNGGDRRGGVVRRRGNHLRPAQSGLAVDRAERCPRRHDLRQDPGGDAEPVEQVRQSRFRRGRRGTGSSSRWSAPRRRGLRASSA